MPIHSIELPKRVIGEIERYPDAIFRNKDETAIGTPVSWDKYPRHEFFNTGLHDCAEGNAISKARHTGWRLIVDQGEEEAVSVEIGIDQEGNPAFDGINMGTYVKATEKALLTASKLVTTKQDMLTRMLRMPQLYIMALWLHDEADTNNDIIIPLDPAPYDMSQDQAMSVEDFEDALKIAAQKKIASAPKNKHGGDN